MALVNETAASAFWPDESPVGRRVRVGEDDPWTTIVGVVRDFEHPGLPTAGTAELYALLESLKEPGRLVNVLLRYDGAGAGLERQVREAVWALDSELPVPAVGTAEEEFQASLALTPFYTGLLGPILLL